MSLKATRPNPFLWVTFAVRTESKYFRRTLSEKSGTTIWLTGIGSESARRKLENIFQHNKPRYLISSGFAGGLNPAFSRDTILMEADETFPPSLQTSVENIQSGTFLCSSSVVVTVEEKQKLWEETQLDAVDMESKIIRQLAREHSIPSATIRIISDAANESLPLNFNAFMRADQSIDIAKLILHCCVHPSRIKALIAFQKRLEQSSQKLGATLNTVVLHLNLS